MSVNLETGKIWRKKKIWLLLFHDGDILRLMLFTYFRSFSFIFRFYFFYYLDVLDEFFFFFFFLDEIYGQLFDCLLRKMNHWSFIIVKNLISNYLRDGRKRKIFFLESYKVIRWKEFLFLLFYLVYVVECCCCIRK